MDIQCIEHGYGCLTCGVSYRDEIASLKESLKAERGMREEMEKALEKIQFEFEDNGPAENEFEKSILIIAKEALSPQPGADVAAKGSQPSNEYRGSCEEPPL
jgi:hypothetical protein